MHPMQVFGAVIAAYIAQRQLKYNAQLRSGAHFVIRCLGPLIHQVQRVHIGTDGRRNVDAWLDVLKKNPS